MIENIFQKYKVSTYDFRPYACPHDPMKDLFDEWIYYYRIKWAIAKVLQPSSILELDVGYGYSAHAFLNAAPKSRYVGMSTDQLASGGNPGALNWAKECLKDFDFELIKENSKSMSNFPCGLFDLVHVNGRQDGDGIFCDLNLAVNQGHHILIDSYFRTRENFLATNEWLWFNKAAIEWTLTIPGYTGEMLIKTSIQPDLAAEEPTVESTHLANCYTDKYYLTDCGGYTQWHRNKGKNLEDIRLLTVANVVWALALPKRVIDLGAGRGELTFHFAKAGAAVTSIDYSKDAISLIEQTFEGAYTARERVKLVCASVTDSSIYEGNYNVAVASDIIEHLSPTELEIFYALVSQHLNSDDGFFVVHTAPNLWHYRYEHPRRQRAAKQAGCWLPKQQRTFYERLMHINEQSPAVLKKQLARHFPYVHLWFADGGNSGGSLFRHYAIADMRQATDLFAVASHRPINLDTIKSALCMKPLLADEAAKITLSVTGIVNQMKAGKSYAAQVALHNGSNQLLCSHQPHPFNLSYHWEDETTGTPVAFDGVRTQLMPPCRPGSEQSYEMVIKAPDSAGCYALKLAPVQEMVRWHESASPVKLHVKVF